jgi:hypothetical protein
MGQTLSSLSPGYRALIYRQLAAASLRQAESATDEEGRAGHLSMAVEWHMLAMEMEGSIRRFAGDVEDDLFDSVTH